MHVPCHVLLTCHIRLALTALSFQFWHKKICYILELLVMLPLIFQTSNSSWRLLYTYSRFIAQSKISLVIKYGWLQNGTKFRGGKAFCNQRQKKHSLFFFSIFSLRNMTRGTPKEHESSMETCCSGPLRCIVPEAWFILEQSPLILQCQLTHHWKKKNIILNTNCRSTLKYISRTLKFAVTLCYAPMNLLHTASLCIVKARCILCNTGKKHKELPLAAKATSQAGRTTEEPQLGKILSETPVAYIVSFCTHVVARLCTHQKKERAMKKVGNTPPNPSQQRSSVSLEASANICTVF